LLDVVSHSEVYKTWQGTLQCRGDQIVAFHVSVTKQGDTPIEQHSLLHPARAENARTRFQNKTNAKSARSDLDNDKKNILAERDFT
jgi:hypothetical protein